MRILLVEDTRELAESIRDRLAAEGHAVDVEGDGAGADALLAHAVFDLVILDVHLPGLSGFEVLSRMRNRGDTTPVLILTARSQIDDRVTGLDVGADDYMVKPVDFRELAARCRAIVRRRSGAASNRFSAGNFVFDRSARRASVADRDLELRPREVQALELFLANLDRVMTKEEVADRIYTFDEAPSLNAVEQTLTRLRRKLTGTPLTIRTIRGLGYIASVTDG
ncbi:response regulator transcription factor [Acuticoccus sp. I52.16.1]|uniref:response regulator transcription factor n=1 Tax=Acuticoccus sp. I52.16.1 TaxID=2928472 RepID=UPI001FD005B7|nr:response regulator transcription factor [Acuticoccus sp. I52.16.1]UOM32697.1 response regulator transcription factor [Acuticoccus sp. I52.16.1]